jgi:geranylgeranylglycerol-phosphate geranylgeranyltransferase
MIDDKLSPRFLLRPARFVTDLLVLSRPVAALCAGTQLLIGAHLTNRTSQPAVGGALLLQEGIAISLVAAAVNVVNDIVDVRADAISRPRRPLPAGRMSTTTAWRLASVQGLVALAFSVGVPSGLAVTLVLLLIGLSYSYLLKGTVLVGNLVVALLAATPIVYGGRLGGAPLLPVLLAGMIVFAFMFAFEVLKTIRDVVADEAAGYRTVATQWGIRSTSAVFRISLAAYAVLAAAPLLLDGVSVSYFVFMWLGAVIPSLIAGWHFPIERSMGAVRPVLRVMAMSWFPGLVAFASAFHR